MDGPDEEQHLAADRAGAALVDAGVGHAEHVDLVAKALGGAALARVLITHWHPDHVRGLPALQDRWPGLKVVDAAGPDVPAGDGSLAIIATPGTRRIISASSMAPRAICCWRSRAQGGRSSFPRGRGDLRAYLTSLARIRDLAPKRLLPGHGPIVEDPIALIDEYIAHRAQREQQILQAMLDGARTVDEIVRRVYPALPASLSEGAADTVRAHLAKLRDDGRSDTQARRL